ncbi:uncharacterized protein LOC133899678 [Phragmites australis]|uniref:uncharacterized protein LOC133899678 n=1 Tax=Phragmites australis TaxID=29695 RepID=UPI002D776D4E|nr:uncharacterized protein LOC133899678 [Phragmites australis]
MEEWRKLAEAVPGTLLIVAQDTTTGLLSTVESTHRKLAACVHVVGMYRTGARRNDIGDATDAPLAGGFPSADLDGALRELARLGALHAWAGHVFVLYGARFGLQGVGDPLWQSWQQHRADTLGHAADALRRLRAAASHSRATEDAIRVARSFPRGSPDWNAWMSASLQLAPHAIVGTAMAFLALRRMRDAVAREFYDAWRALN